MVTFSPDKTTYIRVHAIVLLIAAIAAGFVLVVIGREDTAWVGPVGATLAISFRGWFLMSEAMAETWDLTEDRLIGPGGRIVPLARIRLVRSLGGSIQIVTHGGDKHLIKYQADPAAVISQIETARQRARQDNS